MSESQHRRGFDDTAKEALQLLLQNFWILRDQDPEKYQIIRDREKALRDYVLDKLGYRLIIHRYFAKLEKIPARPEGWMGISAFSHPRDYAVFCCLLAFLEGKAADEQFLLSNVCEELESVYPGEKPLDWRNYEHRKSLVRVLHAAIKFGVLRVVDGDTASFHFNEESEVLYEVTVAARYFMRSYPKDLFQFHTIEDILAEERDSEEGGLTQRRHRVYRQLVLSPSFEQDELEEVDFQYLVQYRNRLQDDLEKHTGWELEVYRDTALLAERERSQDQQLFPDQKAISDIALQFSSMVREKLFQEEPELMMTEQGDYRLTPVEWEQWTASCRQRYGRGWSKQYREAMVRTVGTELYNVLESWKMAGREEDTGRVILKPLLFRLSGHYPKEFTEDKGETPPEQSAPSDRMTQTEQSLEEIT